MYSTLLPEKTSPSFKANATSSISFSSLGWNDGVLTRRVRGVLSFVLSTFDLYRNKQFTIKTSYMLSTAPPVSQYWAGCLQTLPGRATRFGWRHFCQTLEKKKKKKKLVSKSILHVKNEVSNCTRLVCSASCQRQRNRSITFNVNKVFWVFLGMQIKY